MTLTAKRKKEIWKHYDTWMTGYLNADVATYNRYFDDSYHFIGSTNNEEFLNRKDTTEFFKVTGDQFAGLMDLRNESKTLEQFGDHVFLTHICDVWFKNDKDWSYYGRFRLSSVLHPTKDGWKFIYQHFSMPDSKSDEGETIGFDKVNIENFELREAIKRRTIELEAKNRELEIETALERIRAQATAMKESSELLDIVVTMRNEFTKLGHEAHYFWHMMWLPDNYEKAMTSGDGTRIGFVMKLPRHIHGNIPLLSKWEKSKEATVVYAMTASEAINYVDKMVDLGDFQNIDPQAPSHDDIRQIGGLTFIMARTTHGEIGYSLPGIVENPPKEDLQILERFADTFDLAHRRFLDLQKAEQQAREVEIELALEKVRSRTMAMQKSEELADVATVLFQQVKALGIEQWTCGFNIWETGDTEFTFYPGGPDGELLPSCKVPLFEHPIFRQFDESRRRGDGLLVYEKEGEEQKNHYRYMRSLPGMGDMLQNMLDQGMEFPEYQIDHVANFAYGNIVFITYEPFPEMHDVFKRFAKVFEQTYTRFLDLRKAEVQARKAQIELGLERVRARAMAMQNTNELSDLVGNLLQELTKLDFSLTFCIINIVNEPDNSNMVWAANPEEGKAPESYYMRFEDYPFHHAMMREWKAQTPKFIYVMEGEEKEIYDDYLYTETEFSRFPKEVQTANRALDKYVSSFVFSKFGGLQTVGHQPLSDENLDILYRFGKVFDLTYTRFNDLQKAEEQAREAQIEAALEKVRSRSLAVHKSDEFNDVVSIVFEKLKELQIPVTAFGIGIKIEGSKDLNSYVCGENEAGLVITNYRLPYFKNKISEDLCTVIEKELDFYVGRYTKKEKNTFYKHVLEHTPEFKDLPKDILDMIFDSSSYTISMVASKHIVFNINDFEGKDLTEHEIDILKRFSKVFNQAYIRFLDLQKAEAQAREAQIEVALERVRSQSMAMHSSDELKEVVKVIFDQMAHLKINAEHAGMVVDYEPKKDFHFWVADNQDIPARITVPYLDLVWDRQFTEAKKKGKDFFKTQLNFEEKNSFYKHLLPHIKNLTKEAEDFYLKCPGLAASTVVQKDIGLYIENFSGIPFSDEENAILIRFAKVFQQTYTRFLDLQKAEAQARESEIQLAMERVRASTMAMHHSDELSTVLSTLFEQFDVLGIKPSHAVLTLINKEKNTLSFRTTGKNGYQVLGEQEVDLNVVDAWLDTAEKWKKSEPNAVNVNEYPPEILPEVWGVYRDILDAIPKKARPEIKDFPEGLYITEGYCKFGYIGFAHNRKPTEEEKDIVRRLAAEFGTLYQRFLDLQKAEAQAREAQIEAALEKVRSRTMAMQTGEEVKDVVVLLYKELIKLGVTNFVTCGYVEINETTSRQATWVTSPGGDSLGLFHLPLTGDATFDKRYKAWKNRQEVFHQTVAGKIRQKHLEYAITTFNSKEAEEMVMKQFPDPTVFYCFNFSHGYLHLVADSHMTKDEETLLARFTKVFEQTYTRFLDLKKAEAQAREAQIEAALEKVRSRTMAMQKSDELQNAAQVLFNEIMGLGIPSWSCGYNVLSDDKKSCVSWMSSEGQYQKPFTLLFEKEASFIEMYKFFKSEETILIQELSGKAIQDHYTYMKTLPTLIPLFEEFDAMGIPLPEYQINHLCKFNRGYLLFITYEKVPEAHDIFKRFTKVFEQTYTRFLDLQKAEAQAREAQIEAALERVRSQSMGMQNSLDLGNVTTEMFNQLRNFGEDLFATGIVFCDKHTGYVEQWHSIPNGEMLSPFIVPVDLDYIHQYRYDQWKLGNELFSIEIPSDFIEQHFEDIFNLPSAQIALKDLESRDTPMPAAPPWEIDYGASFKNGYLLISSLKHLKNTDILPRFAKVFEQTYARFLDLQKAEAQARESQIENALEKVRSRTMAMQHSNELPEAANNLFLQVQALGIPAWSAGYCIWENNQKSASCNMSSEGEIQKGFSLPTIGEGYNFYDPYKNGESFYVAELGGEELVKHYEFMTKLPVVGEIFEGFEKAGISLPTFQIFHIVYFTHGYLMFITYEPVPNDWDIFKRFGKVFEQTFTRFLDLQKAEAQTREAQISLAVERVRAKALAMHKSEEIIEVVAKLKDEVMSLDIPDVVAATIFLNEGDDKVRMWDLSSIEKNDEGYQSHLDITFKFKKTDPHLYVKRVWENPANYFTEIQEGKDFKRIIAWLRENKKTQVADDVEAFIEKIQLQRLYHVVKKLNNGKLAIDLLNPPSAEMETILTKMGAAFDLAYKRFEDLQKAEAQAREAQIENALEKVRSRSLTMNKPDELQEVVKVVAEKLKELGVIFDVGGVILCTYFPNNKDVNHWIASPDLSSSQSYLVPYFDNPIFSDAWDSKERGDDFFSKEFPVEAKNHFFEYAFKHSDYKYFPDDYKQHVLQAEKHHLTAAWAKNSAILIPSLTGVIPSESDADIMKRFAKVFEQAYIRFMDLQKAEAQARESQIEAALERVRARALAMHNPEELKEVSHVLRTEMGLLGVEELETSSIYINDENTEKTECWYAIKDIRSKKQKLVNDHFELNLNDTWVGKKMLKFYNSKNERVSIKMTGKNRKEWIDYCEERSAPLKGYYGKEIPDRTYHLQKFSHGAIGVATAGDISDENWNLLKRAALVFSLAYSRFKDLTQALIDLAKLKEEKKRAEEALSELQTTQKQLIQSEKMASLGELTAGIAHEIQNPLNFVNNFSEVSKELLDEMQEEIENGDFEEVKTIMADVIQNLEKINHHGKRADGIVKGMLQHSRASGDKKEPTDINALADEYFRLAYHGLRAKDKSFNAELVSDFDESIKSVMVVPQDIGRVILNLLTNAFYVVHQKKQSTKADFKPLVSISTKKKKNIIEIKVTDNGSGIPNHVKEKIFQPFFTTKPTGEGTGLGLSLSYDIITKGHGGDLKVDTKEGEGTTFKIELPYK